MSIARTLFKLGQYQISSVTTAPYSNDSMTGGTVGAALDWIFAVLYPNTQPSVANVAALPAAGNTLNDYRIVLDDGDGKAAGYRWELREGEATPSWHKIHDMDWSSDTILASFMDATQDLFIYKQGRQDLDASGNPITGTFAGQSIFGGTSAGENLTLNANSGDGTGPQSGHVQFNSDARPTSDDTFDLGTATERFRDIFLNGTLTDGILSLTLQNLQDAYDHSLVTNANPHNTSYDDLSTQLGTLTLDGDVSGSADLSTSGNKTLTVTVADDSHSHDALSTINNFDTAVYNELKLQLVDNGPLTWVFDDAFEEVTPTLSIDITDVAHIAAPVANKILASNAAGTDWVASSGQIDLTGDVTGTATFNSTTGKWSLATTVSSSNISGLGGVVLNNKTFTSASGTPTTVTATAHGMQTGEKVRIYGSTTLDGEKTVTVVNANSFTIPDTTAGAQSGYYIPQGGQLLFNTSTGNFQVAKEFEEIFLSELSGLTQDVLTQYVAKDGRTGGQTVKGGISASENLILESTNHATKGTIQLKDTATPFADAAYSGSWSGVNLGSSSKRFNDLYMAGEAKGLRLESVGSLPSSSGTAIGRLVIFGGKPYYDTGSTYTKIGSGDVAVLSKSANYTALMDDDVILCTNTITISLPLAASATKRLVIKNTGTGTVTIDASGSETIDGALTYDLSVQYESITIVSDGTGWYII